MWSSKKLSLTALLFLSLVPIGACGFQPLYANKSGGAGAADLATIRVKVIADRLGQQLRNQLIDVLTPRGAPDRPLYSLQVRLRESTQRLAVRKNSFATRANYKLSARFILRDSTTGKSLFEGREAVISSYNISRSDYTTLVGAKDARVRATRALGEDIRTRLGVFFRQRAPQ